MQFFSSIAATAVLLWFLRRLRPMWWAIRVTPTPTRSTHFVTNRKPSSYAAIAQLASGFGHTLVPGARATEQSLATLAANLVVNGREDEPPHSLMLDRTGRPLLL
ncbi:hypothetical protein BB8028_0005g10920 [Beauveria bassiana]|uniref:Uncharacterized protein n=1 Tax=Beauveria bassiana TaxID=176275 RepID=A0A2S7YHB0_BEABA|nr:hypothetical protein BB8028_0005g10920 [Beauveria bassiana]